MDQKSKASKIQLGIIKGILPYWATILAGASLIWLIIGDIRDVYSTLLGGVFSFFALKQMIEDQTLILIKMQRRRVFISFVYRLFIYAIPVIIGLRYPNYFKFWVILLFLFCSQLIFIVREAILNYKHYKDRMKNDG